MVLELAIDPSRSGLQNWADTSLTIAAGNGQELEIRDNRIIVINTGEAEINLSGSLSGIFSLIGSLKAQDGYTSVAENFQLDCYLAALQPIHRYTRDLDANGQIDAIELVFKAPLNDDFSNFKANVDGMLVSGYNTGSTAKDEKIIIELEESGISDTDRVPNVELVDTTGLMDSTNHVQVLNDNGTPVASTDGAPPVLLEAIADDGSAPVVGIDNGDEVKLKYSEIVQYVPLFPQDLDTTFTLSSGHTWLDGSNNFAGFSFNQKELTIILSANVSVPTIQVGDTITMSGTLIKDSQNNSAVGAVILGGTFEPELQVEHRYTLDLDENGHIDAIDLEYTLDLNDDLSGPVELHGGRHPLPRACRFPLRPRSRRCPRRQQPPRHPAGC